MKKTKTSIGWIENLRVVVALVSLFCAIIFGVAICYLDSFTSSGQIAIVTGFLASALAILCAMFSPY